MASVAAPGRRDPLLSIIVVPVTAAPSRAWRARVPAAAPPSYRAWRPPRSTRWRRATSPVIPRIRHTPTRRASVRIPAPRVPVRRRCGPIVRPAVVPLTSTTAGSTRGRRTVPIIRPDFTLVNARSGIVGSVSSREVHTNASAVQILPVQRVDGRLGAFDRLHSHKAEPTRTTATSIVNNDNLFGRSDGFKLVLEISFDCADRETKDAQDGARIDVGGDVAWFRGWRAATRGRARTVATVVTVVAAGTGGA